MISLNVSDTRLYLGLLIVLSIASTGFRDPDNTDFINAGEYPDKSIVFGVFH